MLNFCEWVKPDWLRQTFSVLSLKLLTIILNEYVPYHIKYCNFNLDFQSWSTHTTSASCNHFEKSRFVKNVHFLQMWQSRLCFNKLKWVFSVSSLKLLTTIINRIIFSKFYTQQLIFVSILKSHDLSKMFIFCKCGKADSISTSWSGYSQYHR